MTNFENSSPVQLLRRREHEHLDVRMQEAVEVVLPVAGSEGFKDRLPLAAHDEQVWGGEADEELRDLEQEVLKILIKGELTLQGLG